MNSLNASTYSPVTIVCLPQAQDGLRRSIDIGLRCSAHPLLGPRLNVDIENGTQTLIWWPVQMLNPLFFFHRKRVEGSP